MLTIINTYLNTTRYYFLFIVIDANVINNCFSVISLYYFIITITIITTTTISFTIASPTIISAISESPPNTITKVIVTSSTKIQV